MMKTILVYILKLFNVTISIAVFIVPGLYFDSIGPLCITWLFALMTFSYLDEAVNKIEESQIKRLITTDTIDNSKKIIRSKKIEIISLAPMISEAMKRIANSTSVSSLFK